MVFVTNERQPGLVVGEVIAMRCAVRRFSVLLALVLAFGIAMPTDAQADPAATADGLIIGTITDVDLFEALGDILVFAYDKDECETSGSWSVFRQAYTDSSGQYRLENLPAGRYVIRFMGEFDGYLNQYYDNVPDPGGGVLPWAAAVLELADGEVMTGIDAKLVAEDAPPPGPSVTRLAGPTRYETAVEISEEFYSAGVAAAYVTRGDNYPDGLAAAPPAAIREPGPILLTQTDRLPAAVIAELDRLQPQKIYVLGGNDVVSDGVMQRLGQWAPTQRLEGPTRYETASAISGYFFSTWRNGNPYAVVARGDSFPDALAGGPLAAQLSAPMLLVRPDSIPESVSHELDSLQLYEKIYVLGGSDVVSSGVEAALAARGIAVERLAGPDRYATAAEIYNERTGAWNRVAFIATGENFPDALAGGAPAGMLNAPMLLVQKDRIPPATAAALANLKPKTIYVLGDSGVVSDSVAVQLAAYMEP